MQLLEDRFEKLCIYNFSIDYPSICDRIEFNPKSKRDGGDLVFHLPDKEKIFLTWGKLDNARKKFQTLEEYAEYSINEVRRGAKGGLFERTPPRSLRVNSHNAVYNQTSLSEPSLGFLKAHRKSTKRGTYSIHLYCDQSCRFFVVYELLSRETEMSSEETFMKMVNSFKCH